jgi:uncharacterized protein (TIGR00369 family)
MTLDPAIERNVRASFARQGLMTMIGAAIASIRSGSVQIELHARPDLTQQHGFLHAAIVSAILDTACGYAALTMMPADSDVVSVEFKVNFLAPAVGDRFVARARVKRAGRTLSVTEADCFAMQDGGEKLVATMLATMTRARPASEDWQ